MKNWAASVRDRLKNKMKLTGEAMSTLELQYIQERFLYRLSQSDYKDNFVLKGGILFYAWAELKYRPTKDLDFMFYGDLNHEQLLNKIIKICKYSYPEDGIEFQFDSFSIQNIKEDQEYGGVRILFNAKIGTSLTRMMLDVCTGDKIIPSPKELSFPLLLSEQKPVILKMYPMETVISEKVHAMIILDLANSRMKDFFDVYILITEFKAEFKSETLKEAIKSTFTHRKTEIPNASAKVWTDYFFDDKNKKSQWNAFLRKNKVTNKVSLEVVCKEIALYINPIFQSFHK